VFLRYSKFFHQLLAAHLFELITCLEIENVAMAQSWVNENKLESKFKDKSKVLESINNLITEIDITSQPHL